MNKNVTSFLKGSLLEMTLAKILATKPPKNAEDGQRIETCKEGVKVLTTLTEDEKKIFHWAKDADHNMARTIAGIAWMGIEQRISQECSLTICKGGKVVEIKSEKCDCPICRSGGNVGMAVIEVKRGGGFFSLFG